MSNKITTGLQIGNNLRISGINVGPVDSIINNIQYVKDVNYSENYVTKPWRHVSTFTINKLEIFN